jgi:hypothetical protein
VSREVTLVQPDPAVAKIVLPTDSADELKRFYFFLELKKGATDRILELRGCGTGARVTRGGELYLRGQRSDILRYVTEHAQFKVATVYLKDSCPLPQGISIVGSK